MADTPTSLHELNDVHPVNPNKMLDWHVPRIDSAVTPRPGSLHGEVRKDASDLKAVFLVRLSIVPSYEGGPLSQ